MCLLFYYFGIGFPVVDSTVTWLLGIEVGVWQYPLCGCIPQNQELLGGFGAQLRVVLF